MATFQHKPNRGSLFPFEKQKDGDRDYAGSALIDGVEFWVSGWRAETKAGRKYLNLSFKPAAKPSARDNSNPFI
jgi:hypothetical protein